MGLWPACKPSCPAAAVPMRVLRGRGAAGKLCVRACGPEEPNSIRIRIQLAARSSTTSGVVPLPLAVAHVVLVSQSVSQSVTTTLLPTEHMAHTHTLVFSFFERGGISASFVFWQGSHFRMMFFFTLRFHLSSCWRRS